MSENVESKRVEEYIEGIKRGLYEKIGQRSKEELFQLMEDASCVLDNEKEKGRGKLRDKIENIVESEHANEYFVDEYVVYLPKGGEACFIGDLHGDLECLKAILEDTQFFENMEAGKKDLKLVFLGDYKDRGDMDIELLELLMNLKVRYLDNIVLLRGNHEYRDTPVVVGEQSLAINLYKKYRDNKIFNKYFDFFEKLPGVVVTGNGIVAVHGGIPSEEINSLKDLNKEKNRKEIAWNDPDKTISGDGFAKNFNRDPKNRGLVKTFGYKAFIRFRKAIGSKVMIRSHEEVSDGVEDIWMERFLTVFSNRGGGRTRPKYIRTSLEKIKERWELDDVKNISI